MLVPRRATATIQRQKTKERHRSGWKLKSTARGLNGLQFIEKRDNRSDETAGQLRPVVFFANAERVHMPFLQEKLKERLFGLRSQRSLRLRFLHAAIRRMRQHKQFLDAAALQLVQQNIDGVELVD